LKKIELDYISPHTRKSILTSTNPTTHLLDLRGKVFRPNKALSVTGTKLKSTYKSLELTTAIRLTTVIHYTSSKSSLTSYKDYDQTSTTTQHSINQPCGESVNFDIKWVDKRVAASCKNAYWYNIPDARLFLVWI